MHQENTQTNITTEPACPTYPQLCTNTDPGHGDHSNHLNAAATDWPVNIGFVHLEDSPTPLLYIAAGHTADFDPENTPKVAGQLRAAANALEGLRDRIDTALTLADIRRVRTTARPALADILTIVENAIEDGADPAAVFSRVLELTAQARTEGGELR